MATPASTSASALSETLEAVYMWCPLPMCRGLRRLQHRGLLPHPLLPGHRGKGRANCCNSSRMSNFYTIRPRRGEASPEAERWLEYWLTVPFLDNLVLRVRPIALA